MIDKVIPLVGSFLTDDIATVFLIPIIALCFIATIPCIIRYFWRS